MYWMFIYNKRNKIKKEGGHDQIRQRAAGDSESSGSFFNYQPRPKADFKGRLEVGQDVHLLDGCEMVGTKCECSIPWKLGLCTKFVEEGKEGLRCECRNRWEEEFTKINDE